MNFRKAKKLIIISDLIFVGIYLSASILLKFITSIKTFPLDSSDKYIISMKILDNDTKYYEIDFSKNSVILRKDEEYYFKRQKLKKVDTDFNLLQEFLIQITNDSQNKELTESDRQNLFKNNLYTIYKITNFKNETYYVKDPNQVIFLENLLKK